jgi:adenylylsulfate kinase-like enzyme
MVDALALGASGGNPVEVQVLSAAPKKDNMSKIVLITGPAGAGKSSIAKSLVKNLPGTWALIIQDDTRAFVKSGF